MQTTGCNRILIVDVTMNQLFNRICLFFSLLLPVAKRGCDTGIEVFECSDLRR
jgi:hypothetical protein